MTGVLDNPAVIRFDAWADERLESLRAKPALGKMFRAASHLGDHSLIWLLAAAGRGATSDRRADQGFALAAALGAESLLVNQGLKRLFNRTRPTPSGDERFPVRTPWTTSFPSGHASTAMFAAALLTAMGGRRTAPLWYGAAAVVATSRAFVRIHHASDVVAGAATGAVLGAVARRALRRASVAGPLREVVPR